MRVVWRWPVGLIQPPKPPGSGLGAVRETGLWLVQDPITSLSLTGESVLFTDQRAIVERQPASTAFVHARIFQKVLVKEGFLNHDKKPSVI